ncbi:MAG TPA: tRNA pseudouridine(55) synthase TruB [Acidimicrobiales bacterium]|nr:tRNA pseudouridine(55) synthase TruB [Acidimicrobiales bacterium]
MSGGLPPGPDGVAVVDKPAGWTSHDAVARARRLLGTRKVGHSGTLDPDATGVLVLGVGKATRLLRYLLPLGKAYEAEIVLGVETTTLDAAGEVTARHDMGGVTVDDARRVAAGQLTGPILQVPPMVSALKVDGRRLHELARQGIEVEREARPVTVHAFALDEVPGEPGVLRATVECSSGTYVRTLAADLGRALGGGAHLRALRRTAVGTFTLDAAVALDDLEPGHLRPPAAAVAHLPAVTVEGHVAVAVGHGKVLDRPTVGLPAEGDGPWAVLDPAGALVAVYVAHRDDTVKPELVIPA